MKEKKCARHSLACECRESAFQAALEILERLSGVWCSNLIRDAGNREAVVNQAAGLRHDVERVIEELGVFIPKGETGDKPKRKISGIEQEIERGNEADDDADEDPFAEDGEDGAGEDSESA